MPKFAKPWYRASRGVWYVNWGGKQINLGPDRRSAFEEYARLVATPACRESTPAPAHSLPAVLDAFLHWLKPRRAADTFEWYRYRLERLAQRHPTLAASSLSCSVVEDWVDSYPISKTSRRNYFRAVKKAYKWARSRGLIKRNPIRNLEVPAGEAREVVLAEDLYAAMLGMIRDRGFWDLVVTTWETGCRPQESLRVEARHVDLQNQRWVFPRSESKTRKISRVVYLTDVAAEITARRLREWPAGHLFRNKLGQPWTTDAVNNMFGRLRTRIGMERMRQQGLTIPKADVERLVPTLAKTRRIKGKLVQKSGKLLLQEARRKLTTAMANQLVPRLSLYAIRHTWATNALQTGVDPLTTAILMGHSDPSMLSKVYQHVALNPAHMLEQAKRAATGRRQQPPPGSDC